MLIRSLIFTTLFFLTTLVLSLTVVLLAPFSFAVRLQIGVVWAHVNLWLLKHDLRSGLRRSRARNISRLRTALPC